MSARPHSDMTMADLDDILREQDLSEDDIQRIYDLRYCTILVPITSRRQDTQPEQDDTLANTSNRDGARESGQLQESADLTASTTATTTMTMTMTSLHPSPEHSPSANPVAHHAMRTKMPLTPPRATQETDKSFGLLTPQEMLTPAVLAEAAAAAALAKTDSSQADDGNNNNNNNEQQDAYSAVDRYHHHYHHLSSDEVTIDDSGDGSDVFLTASEYLTDLATSDEPALSSSNDIGVAGVTESVVAATEAIKLENPDDDIAAPIPTFINAASHTPEPAKALNDTEFVGKSYDLQNLKRSASSASLSSPSSLTKRRHWELSSPTGGLLHERQPESPKRQAFFTRAFSGRSLTLKHDQDQDQDQEQNQRSLLSAQSLESPSYRASSSMSIKKSLSSRSGSSNSYASLFNSTIPISLQETVAEGAHEWTRSNWQNLERVYLEMEGDTQSEAGLGQIADCFIAEEAARAGGESHWDRQKILTRCIALQMVEREKRKRTPTPSPDKMPMTPYTPLLGPRQVQTVRRKVRGLMTSPGTLGMGRTSSQPYPTNLLHAAHSINNRPSKALFDPPLAASSSSTSGESTPTSPVTAMSMFMERQRYHRNQQRASATRELEQGSQLKAVFKQKVAQGLSSVRQLLPFWKEVERGETGIKEEVEVPLVRPRTVQDVVEALETQNRIRSSANSSRSSNSGSLGFSVVREGSVVSSRSDSASQISWSPPLLSSSSSSSHNVLVDQGQDGLSPKDEPEQGLDRQEKEIKQGQDQDSAWSDDEHPSAASAADVTATTATASPLEP